MLNVNDAPISFYIDIYKQCWDHMGFYNRMHIVTEMHEKLVDQKGRF